MNATRLYKIFNIAPIIKNDIWGYQYIAGLYHELKKTSVSDVGIDFSLCRMFDANLSSALGAIIDLLTEEGFRISLLNIDKSTAGVRRALTRNGFFKGIRYTDI